MLNQRSDGDKEKLTSKGQSGEDPAKKAEQETPGISPYWTPPALAELSGVIILELGRLLKACNLQGKNWTVSCGQLEANSALSPAAAPHPHPSQWAGSCAHAPGTACAQLVGTRVGKKTPSSKDWVSML